MSSWAVQFGWELRKMFTRRRTYLGFTAFVVFQIWLVVLFQFPAVRAATQRWVEHAGFTFADNFSGLTLASFIMGQTINFLGAAFLALVAGEIVAGEVEDGSMRMVLCRPVSRARVLLLKWWACAVYTAVLIVFVAFTGLLIGLVAEGPGNLLVLSPLEDIAGVYPFAEGLGRYFLSLPLRVAFILTVTCAAFFLSCAGLKPVAATTLTLAFFLADEFLRKLVFFEPVKDWFLMARMVAWLHVFEKDIPWLFIGSNLLVLVAVDVVLVAGGIALFARRSFKP